jgi:hypothetical protein
MMFNSVAILNNDRFLERCELLLLVRPCASTAHTAASCKSLNQQQQQQCPSHLVRLCALSLFVSADGWGFSQMQSSNSLKMSIIGGIHAVHYFRGECVGLPVVLRVC